MQSLKTIIIIGKQNTQFASNRLNNNKNCFIIEPLKTTKRYFSNLENIYFLIISIFQLLTISILPSEWSPTGPYSTTIPLLLCLLLDIIVDCIRWMQIYRNDSIKNNTIYNIWDFNTNSWISKKSMDIYPGSIISISKDTIIPMDILLIDYFSNDYCKCSLSNLNGESNLITITKLSNMHTINDYKNANILVLENNKNSIFNINGNIQFSNGTKLDWDSRMFLVNGSKMISNGGIGIVISCGRDLKLLNSSIDNNSFKKLNSTMDKISNFMMNTTIYILISIVFYISINKTYYNYYDNMYQYIGTFILHMIQNWIVLNGLIPFSIKILLNSLRHFQSKQTSKYNILINTPYLIDQFSSIEYILSDKTGTLTKNNLELMTLIDYENNVYNLENTNKLISKNILRSIGLSIGYDSGEYCTPEDKTIHQRYIYLNSRIEYNNDEIRLILYDNIETYRQIKISKLNFSTLRPISSSVFYNLEDNKYYIYTKASISKLRTILKEEDKIKLDEIDNTITNIDASLRTIAIGFRELDICELNTMNTLNTIERELYALNFEKDLNLIGILGIQDKLIDDIQNTIKWIQHQNISMGILTGDRKITAIAIAKKTGIINENSKIITFDNVDDMRNIYMYNIEPIKNNTLIIFNNSFLIEMISTYDNEQMFINILKNRPLLLGYSLTPSGKKIIADLLEIHICRTLTIGDGYNDIPMIQSSNIGIGVSESIKYSSDFNIQNFNTLVDLFSYGYAYSIKNQIIALFTVYKTCSIGFILAWYILYSSTDISLFTFTILQGFNLLWCIIHPVNYALNIKNVEKTLLKNTSKILNNYSMSFWIGISALHSSILYYILQHLINWRSMITFMIIFQVNTMLLCFDISYQSIFYQFINIVFFFIYLIYFDIGIKAFLDLIVSNFHYIFIYMSIILITHLTISFYYKYNILNNNTNTKKKVE